MNAILTKKLYKESVGIEMSQKSVEWFIRGMIKYSNNYYIEGPQNKNGAIGDYRMHRKGEKFEWFFGGTSLK